MFMSCADRLWKLKKSLDGLQTFFGGRLFHFDDCSGGGVFVFLEIGKQTLGHINGDKWKVHVLYLWITYWYSIHIHGLCMHSPNMSMHYSWIIHIYGLVLACITHDCAWIVHLVLTCFDGTLALFRCPFWQSCVDRLEGPGAIWQSSEHNQRMILLACF